MRMIFVLVDFCDDLVQSGSRLWGNTDMQCLHVVLGEGGGARGKIHALIYGLHTNTCAQYRSALQQVSLIPTDTLHLEGGGQTGNLHTVAILVFHSFHLHFCPSCL